MSDRLHLLPPVLCLNLKIMFEHEGQYHTGFFTPADNGVYCFSYKSHINKKHPHWSNPLPNLTSTWHKLCLDSILIPGHNISSFICDKTANFFLVWECPRSRLYALANKHPNHEVWLQSFQEEKEVLILNNTYETIKLGEYYAYQEKRAPCAILTMCVLTIKPDKMINPH